jgi:hypothetical protein
MVHATTCQGRGQNQGIRRSGTVQASKHCSGVIGTSRTSGKVKPGLLADAVINVSQS